MDIAPLSLASRGAAPLEVGRICRLYG
jgi:hypothetical protein